MKFIAVLMLLCLFGCKQPFAIRTSDDPNRSFEPALYVDRVTGCHYLTTGQANALIARISADGKTHFGCGVNTK